jgi:hypothetical protein
MLVKVVIEVRLWKELLHRYRVSSGTEGLSRVSTVSLGVPFKLTHSDRRSKMSSFRQLSILIDCTYSPHLVRALKMPNQSQIGLKVVDDILTCARVCQILKSLHNLNGFPKTYILYTVLWDMISWKQKILEILCSYCTKNTLVCSGLSVTTTHL